MHSMHTEEGQTCPNNTSVHAVQWGEGGGSESPRAAPFRAVPCRAAMGGGGGQRGLVPRNAYCTLSTTSADWVASNGGRWRGPPLLHVVSRMMTATLTRGAQNPAEPRQNQPLVDQTMKSLC